MIESIFFFTSLSLSPSSCNYLCYQQFINFLQLPKEHFQKSATNWVGFFSLQLSVKPLIVSSKERNTKSGSSFSLSPSLTLTIFISSEEREREKLGPWLGSVCSRPHGLRRGSQEHRSEWRERREEEWNVRKVQKYWWAKDFVKRRNLSR